jgi:hypothetical protein
MIEELFSLFLASSICSIISAHMESISLLVCLHAAAVIDFRVPRRKIDTFHGLIKENQSTSNKQQESFMKICFAFLSLKNFLSRKKLNPVMIII